MNILSLGQRRISEHRKTFKMELLTKQLAVNYFRKYASEDVQFKKGSKFKTGKSLVLRKYLISELRWSNEVFKKSRYGGLIGTRVRTQ